MRRAAGSLGSLLGLAGLALIAGCAGDRAPSGGESPGAVSTGLGGQVVARVGPVALDRALVLAIARAQGVAPKEALARAIDEALLSEAALLRGAPEAPEVRNESASILARALVGRAREEALAKGPWTDEEIAAAMGPSWVDLDRPEARTVVHALVFRKVPGAEALAKKLHDALAAATGEDEASSAKAFTDAAAAFALPGGEKVHVETIEALTEDGRIALPGHAETMQAAFAKGAFSIAKTLGTSDLVESTYGWHVIRLVKIDPPRRASREEKIEKLRPELLARRAKGSFDAMLAGLRAKSQPAIVAPDSELVLPP